MRTLFTPLGILLTMIIVSPAAGQTIIEVSDADGTAARVGAPVSVNVEMSKLSGGKVHASGWHLSEIGAAASRTGATPVQFVPDAPESSKGRLWWLMPKGSQTKRRFGLSLVKLTSTPTLQVNHDKTRQLIDVNELRLPGRDSAELPVLRYNHGTVPVREGTHPHFAQGESYERGDYISPLFGPDGQELTEDYPKDHPHHRGVWWSWPVTRWKDQVADIWAVAGVWSRPVAIRRIAAGPVMALIEVENVWEFGKDQQPIAREEVLIRAFRQSDRCRFVDVEIRLTALADDVAIGGRPKAGYGGFSLRAAPCQQRKITAFTDPAESASRRSWLDYSGLFAGGTGTAGVTIFEHAANPDYPNPLHEYPACNCVMPAYPEAREVVLPKDEPLVLKHRLWIHTGGADEKKLSDAWAAYANPPQVSIVDE